MTKDIRSILEAFVEDGSKKKKRKKRLARDSISPEENRGRRSESVLPAKNLVEAKSEFRPSVAGESLPGYCRCQICSTYFPADLQSRHEHLSQHSDRLFMLTVPTDKFFYNIEDVIKDLARMKFDKSKLQEKVQQCNLLRTPPDLRGFSCDLSQVLDTNDLGVFHDHVKNECKISDKMERLAHLICFCRGCQVILSLPFLL